MRLKVDKDNDAPYFRLDDSDIIKESKKVKAGVILDFNAKGHVVGVEILNLSSQAPAKCLQVLQFET